MEAVTDKCFSFIIFVSKMYILGNKLIIIPFSETKSKRRNFGTQCSSDCLRITFPMSWIEFDAKYLRFLIATPCTCAVLGREARATRAISQHHVTRRSRIGTKQRILHSPSPDDERLCKRLLIAYSKRATVRSTRPTNDNGRSTAMTFDTNVTLVCFSLSPQGRC